jgi:hypothetical protein
VRLFILHAWQWVRRAPGIPCALSSGGRRFAKLGQDHAAGTRTYVHRPAAAGIPTCRQLRSTRGRGFRPRLLATAANTKKPGDGGNAMRRTLLILGLIGLAIGLLWIGQGTGAVAWPRSSFMINEIQWAGYGAALSAVGLILIWQSQRP